MFSRKNAYESADQSTGLNDTSRKLAVDLRKHVRRLEMLPHHTKEWIGLTDSLLHISNVALMEHQLPRDSEDSTLWEGEELTVRFMLEEGKLNLCLRCDPPGRAGWGQAGWGRGQGQGQVAARRGVPPPLTPPPHPTPQPQPRPAPGLAPGQADGGVQEGTGGGAHQGCGGVRRLPLHGGPGV